MVSGIPHTSGTTLIAGNPPTGGVSCDQLTQLELREGNGVIIIIIDFYWSFMFLATSKFQVQAIFWQPKKSTVVHTGPFTFTGRREGAGDHTGRFPGQGYRPLRT